MTNYQEIVGALVIHVASLALAPNDLDLAFGTINQRKTMHNACAGAGRHAHHHLRADERHLRGMENGRWGTRGAIAAAGRLQQYPSSSLMCHRPSSSVTRPPSPRFLSSLTRVPPPASSTSVWPTSTLDAHLDDLLTRATASLLCCALPLLSLAASNVREGERWGIAATRSDPVSGANV
jgi:hypothetical protein